MFASFLWQSQQNPFVSMQEKNYLVVAHTCCLCVRDICLKNCCISLEAVVPRQWQLQKQFHCTQHFSTKSVAHRVHCFFMNELLFVSLIFCFCHSFHISNINLLTNFNDWSFSPKRWQKQLFIAGFALFFSIFSETEKH